MVSPAEDPLARITTKRKLGAAQGTKLPLSPAPVGGVGAGGGVKRRAATIDPRMLLREIPAAGGAKVAELARMSKIVCDRHAKVSDRALGIVQLGRLGISGDAEDALTRVLLDHDDDDRLRVLAIITLATASPPPPGAARAVHRVLLDRESDTVEIGEANGGGTMRTLAAELLVDLPGGRAMLEAMVRRPTGPDFFPWMLAVKMVYGGDSERFLPLVTDIAIDEKRPTDLRIAAILALGGTISGWDPGLAAPGWDTIASLALAKSENSRVRHAATEVLRYRRG